MVIASHDRRFDYRKLQVAFDALWLHKRARSLPPTRTRTALCPEDAASRTRRPLPVLSRRAPAPSAR
jgi:hypothetical protein